LIFVILDLIFVLIEEGRLVSLLFFQNGAHERFADETATVGYTITSAETI